MSPTAKANPRPILELIAEATPAPDEGGAEPVAEYDVEFSVFGADPQPGSHPNTSSEPDIEPPPVWKPTPPREEPVDDPSLPRVMMGRYQLVYVLGRGAMGDVWCARDLQTNGAVAVKFLKEDLGSKDFETRFFREARLLSRVRHPNVLELLDFGAEPVPFLVMEMLRGKDLARVIKSLRRLRLPIAAEIFRQACEGLAAVHEAGIIHRDIKPANIFCVENGPMKIIDFGLAKRPHALAGKAEGSEDGSTIEQFATRVGTLIGTLKYMSPEQLSAVPIDHRADLWAMGVVLFRMLTGKPPFDGETEVDLLLSIVSGEAPSPSAYVKDLPPKVDQFFQRAFQKRPENRFSSAAEMAQAFSSIAGAR